VAGKSDSGSNGAGRNAAISGSFLVVAHHTKQARVKPFEFKLDSNQR
jgi:hypothetical protein